MLSEYQFAKLWCFGAKWDLSDQNFPIFNDFLGKMTKSSPKLKDHSPQSLSVCPKWHIYLHFCNSPYIVLFWDLVFLNQSRFLCYSSMERNFPHHTNHLNFQLDQCFHKSMKDALNGDPPEKLWIHISISVPKGKHNQTSCWLIFHQPER